MAIQNGNNAYKIRYEGNAAEKRTNRRPVVREHPRKHIRPNMTMKLNRKRESKPSFAPKPLVNGARALNPAQIRLELISVFLFGMIILYFVFSVVCKVREHELDHELEQNRAILAELQNDYNGLKIDSENRWSDATVRDYAENKLGMRTRNNHQVYWFEVIWDNDFDD